MNSEQIRNIAIGGSGLSDLFSQSSHPECYLLRELTAQIAELNETIKAKQLTAHCAAHVYIGGDDDSLDGTA